MVDNEDDIIDDIVDDPLVVQIQRMVIYRKRKEGLEKFFNYSELKK